MVLTHISFWQCFYPWFVRVHLVHCPFAFRSSTTFWSIPVCVSAQTVCIIFCRGAVFPFSTFSSFFFVWYTLFSLAVYFGFSFSLLLLAWHVSFSLQNLTLRNHFPYAFFLPGNLPHRTRLVEEHLFNLGCLHIFNALTFRVKLGPAVGLWSIFGTRFQ